MAGVSVIVAQTTAKDYVLLADRRTHTTRIHFDDQLSIDYLHHVSTSLRMFAENAKTGNSLP